MLEGMQAKEKKAPRKRRERWFLYMLRCNGPFALHRDHERCRKALQNAFGGEGRALYAGEKAA